jgi:hypothetical protein
VAGDGGPGKGGAGIKTLCPFSDEIDFDRPGPLNPAVRPVDEGEVNGKKDKRRL